jgi:hypothetical protein
VLAAEAAVMAAAARLTAPIRSSRRRPQPNGVTHRLLVRRWSSARCNSFCAHGWR